MTVAIKPVTEESTKETVKPLCRECRAESGEPVVTTSCFFARNHGCNGHPAFPAPSLEGRAAPSVLVLGETIGKTRTPCAARTRWVAPSRLTEYFRACQGRPDRRENGWE